MCAEFVNLTPETLSNEHLCCIIPVSYTHLCRPAPLHQNLQADGTHLLSCWREAGGRIFLKSHLHNFGGQILTRRVNLIEVCV